MCLWCCCKQAFHRTCASLYLYIWQTGQLDVTTRSHREAPVGIHTSVWDYVPKIPFPHCITPVTPSCVSCDIRESKPPAGFLCREVYPSGSCPLSWGPRASAKSRGVCSPKAKTAGCLCSQRSPRSATASRCDSTRNLHRVEKRSWLVTHSFLVAGVGGKFHTEISAESAGGRELVPYVSMSGIVTLLNSTPVLFESRQNQQARWTPWSSELLLGGTVMKPR